MVEPAGEDTRKTNTRVLDLIPEGIVEIIAVPVHEVDTVVTDQVISVEGEKDFEVAEVGDSAIGEETVVDSEADGAASEEQANNGEAEGMVGSDTVGDSAVMAQQLQMDLQEMSRLVPPLVHLEAEDTITAAERTMFLLEVHLALFLQNRISLNTEAGMMTALTDGDTMIAEKEVANGTTIVTVTEIMTQGIMVIVMGNGAVVIDEITKMFDVMTIETETGIEIVVSAVPNEGDINHFRAMERAVHLLFR